MIIKLSGPALGALALAVAACAPTPNMDPAPPASPDEPDQCRASQYQSWVGRNRSELPAAPAGEVWRVTCSTCPVTMDYNPRRLNIVYDDASGVIRSVRCG